MRHRTSLPLLALLLVTLSACGGTTTDPGSGGGGGGNTGGGNTGGSGGGGGDTGGSGGGGGGGGGDPGCGAYVSKVYACALPDPPPATPDTPWAFTSPGTVTAVRAPDPAEPCAGQENYWHQMGYGAAPEAMIDLVDANGNALTVGVTVPGFTAPLAVTAGDVLSVDFAFEVIEWGGKISRLRLERGGELVVAVGENNPVGLAVVEGPSECYEEDNLCGREELAMAVEAPDGATASIPNGETAEVGALTVTNDRYLRNYDTSGGCNFGLSVEYLLGVSPTP
jgi:hypothetical protein